MDGSGPGSMDFDHTTHLLTRSQDFHSALIRLHYAETAEDVLKYLPPVLQLADSLVEWPVMNELGRLHAVYYKWVDLKPDAGYATGFMRARDDVYERALRLFSSAMSWAQVGDPDVVRTQGAGLILELEASARGAIDLLAAYAPTPEEQAADHAKAKQHQEEHLKQQAEEREVDAVAPQYLPQDAVGRIGHVVAALPALKSAVSALEATEQPDDILLRVRGLIEAATAVGVGAQSEPLAALGTTDQQWCAIELSSTMAPALEQARYALVPAGWAVVQAMELDAEASLGPAGPVTPRTEAALNTLAAAAYEYGAQVSAA